MQECCRRESTYLTIHPRIVASIVTRMKVFASALLVFRCGAESYLRRSFAVVNSVYRLHARRFQVVEAFIYLSGDYVARFFSYCFQFQSRQLTTISRFTTLVLAWSSPLGTMAASFSDPPRKTNNTSIIE